MQKKILTRSIKRKAMLFSKPFTLNCSIELPASNNNNNNKISMALDKVLAKLIIYFIYFDNFVSLYSRLAVNR